MTRLSKAIASWISNLPPQKKHARHASLMSDSDIDNTEDFPRVSEEAETDNDETTDVLAFWVMVDDNVEMDDSDNKEMMVNLDGEAEIHDEGELFKCISILQEAQVEVQRIEAKNNCPHCYTGNSKRTKQRHALQ